eukprot:TRINITY_DN1046_c0_g1_i1.p1 TRINITY_DN1046_c0_g1~~TRINITY_DN1046_c0_g1_i1.p1  ORF type:complete len:585 (+),score=112.33 TRINITY_DN1046_c0_g1_i1:80-1834(+)
MQEPLTSPSLDVPQTVGEDGTEKDLQNDTGVAGSDVAFGNASGGVTDATFLTAVSRGSITQAHSADGVSPDLSGPDVVDSKAATSPHSDKKLSRSPAAKHNSSGGDHEADHVSESPNESRDGKAFDTSHAKREESEAGKADDPVDAEADAEVEAEPEAEADAASPGAAFSTAVFSDRGNVSERLAFEVGNGGSDGGTSARNAISTRDTLWQDREMWRKHMKLILEAPSSSPAAAAFQYVVIVSIGCSVTCAVWETDHSVGQYFAFMILEHFFNFFFSVEIALRFWTSDSNEAFFCSADNLVDLVATLPSTVTSLYSLFYVNLTEEEISNSFDELRMARMIRLVRLLRVLRLAKAMRQSESITVVLTSVWGSMDGLLVLVTFLLLGMLVAATFAWVFESDQPKTEFESIPASFWWAASTIMAVGYGDMIPETFPGKLVAVATMFMGVVIIAICIAVVTNSFSDVYQRNLHAARARRLSRERKEGGGPKVDAASIEAHLAKVQSSGDELLKRLSRLNRSAGYDLHTDRNVNYLRDSDCFLATVHRLWRTQASGFAQELASALGIAGVGLSLDEATFVTANADAAAH